MEITLRVILRNSLFSTLRTIVCAVCNDSMRSMQYVTMNLMKENFHRTPARSIGNSKKRIKENDVNVLQ